MTSQRQALSDLIQDNPHRIFTINGLAENQKKSLQNEIEAHGKVKYQSQNSFEQICEDFSHLRATGIIREIDTGTFKYSSVPHFIYRIGNSPINDNFNNHDSMESPIFQKKFRQVFGREPTTGECNWYKCIFSRRMDKYVGGPNVPKLNWSSNKVSHEWTVYSAPPTVSALIFWD